MKTFLLALSALLLTGFAVEAAWQDDYAQLLRKYVTPTGVRYGAWKKDAANMAAIDRVVDGIGKSKADDLAFYINAYNAWILHEALAKYPTKSVKDALFTFFLANRITVGGNRISFNKLEKEIIRGKFKEPRIHFALNCASRSCPPLLPEPFNARQLDAQLEQLAKAFVNTENGVCVTKSGVKLSKIFDWYKEDFGGVEGRWRFDNQRRRSRFPRARRFPTRTTTGDSTRRASGAVAMINLRQFALVALALVRVAQGGEVTIAGAATLVPLIGEAAKILREEEGMHMDSGCLKRAAARSGSERSAMMRSKSR